ncbi:hypothetical protein [Micromonospora sp. NPDC047074]|uniref:hypothetical protein n=1 Tax=Micromonospora sp. NPDC047074 TaxID=3154339 RepID=UPI0033CC33B5
MVDISKLLPRSRSPRDYLDLIADPRVDREVLCTLAASPYSFVRMAVAEHPLADAHTLATLSTEDLGGWDRRCLLATIARHPNADRMVLLRVLGETRALLRQPGGRPYAAALALAKRPELAAEEILTLATQPGASRRMRRGLRRNLAARTCACGSMSC